MNPIAVSHKMKGGELDDDYTLYDNGEVLHSYDQNKFKTHLKETLKADTLSDDIKQRLLEAASEENRALARQLLGI